MASASRSLGRGDGEEACKTAPQSLYNRSSNEILLFHNNKLLLKAEYGVTLGLIKLIYSSDDNNSGIVLGVKPRLTNQVPCLVTFDSTSLTHDAYDLIIKDFRPKLNNDMEISNKQKSLELSSEEDSANNVDLSIEMPCANSCDTSSSNDGHSSDDSIERPVASTIFLENTHPTIQEISSRSGELPELPSTDLNLYESEDSSDGRKDEAEENESEDQFQFKPEEFDFDITSVTPSQTDKGLRWPCDRCGKDYCSASHLKRHWILHTDFKPYKCKVCSKRFPFHWDLKRHMTKHTGNKRFKCPHCTKSFNTQKELKCHNWLHTGQKEYKCEICHHEISSSGNLKIHMRKHTGEKPYKCEYCPKAFYMLGHYQYHVRRHTGEKPYKCDVCGMAFSYSVNLGEHKNIHTGIKPYSCPTCKKKFTHRSTLKQHILTHSGQRPYKCHLCPKNFVQSSNYRMHLLTHKDKQDRAQKCDLCGKELVSRRGVKKHRQRCAQTLIDRANGVTNKKVKRKKNTKERYECGVCSKLFTYRANYEAHCKLPHPVKKPRKTQASNESKSLNSRNEGKVSCPICGKQFSYMKCIKRHLQKRHAGVEVATRSSAIGSASSREDANMDLSYSLLKCNTRSTQDSGITESLQNKLPEIVKQFPTVHIQPVGASPSSNVTLIYVPSTQGSLTGTSASLIKVLPKPQQEKSADPENSTLQVDTEDSELQLQSVALDSTLVSGYSLSKQTVNDKSKGAETGSQAITALKILSAKIGIEEQFQPLSSRTDEQRPPISKHLTALEQLSKRVGVDEIPVAIESTHDPKDQLTVDDRQDQTLSALQEGPQDSTK